MKLHIPETEVRYVCSDLSCRWIGRMSGMLRAPNPFIPGGELIACPACQGMEFERLCDHPGCKWAATMGSTTPGGYTWTCWEHRPEQVDETKEVQP